MKKKVLFIINTMGQAGAEIALVELLNKLDEQGEYDLFLYVIIPRGELFARLPKSVKILNPRLSHGSVLSAFGRLMIGWETIKSFFYRLTGFRLLPYLLSNIQLQRRQGKVQPDKVLWRLLAEGRPKDTQKYDLAVSFIEGGSAYYLEKKVQAGQKAAFIHIDYGKAGYLPMMDQGCYDVCRRIFVVSNEVGEKFAWFYPQYQEKIVLFRNIINKEYIWRMARSGRGFDDNFSGIRLVTVGRLAYQKGYDIAAQALAILKDRGYQIRWYILGEGPERLALESLIKKLELENDFILLGAKANPYPYILQAQIYVHATRFEGKSIALEEAQVLEKPILASYCTGTAEQIDTEVDGLLIDLSVENLADKLAWLIDRPDIQEQYATQVAQRKLVFPEDLDKLLSLVPMEKEVLK